MRFPKVAIVYANSLYDFAVEKNAITEVISEIEQILKASAGAPELKRLIESPIVKPSIKQSIFSEAFGNSCTAELNTFINLLFARNRMDILFRVFEAFVFLKDERQGIKRAEIISAVKLSSEQESEIKEYLEREYKNKIILSEKQDTSLIGGFVVKVDDRVIDASVANQLSHIRKKLTIADFSVN